LLPTSPPTLLSISPPSLLFTAQLFFCETLERASWIQWQGSHSHFFPLSRASSSSSAYARGLSLSPSTTSLTPGRFFSICPLPAGDTPIQYST
jgi:hypothetical protein